MWAKLFLFILLSFSPISWGNELYQMPDLEILVKEGSFEEFFDHALDIKPSERQEEWKKLVLQSADAFSKSLLYKTDIKKNEYTQIQKIWAWPPVKIDDSFKERRREIGVRYLKACLKEEDPCWREVQSFWETSQGDSETAFQLAELIHARANSPLRVWNFLEVALKSSMSEFYCKKDFVLEALWAKLEIDFIRLGPKGDLQKKIDETIHPDCLPELIKVSSTRLQAPKKFGEREFSFQILSSQSKADQATSDFFYSVYLLENPSQGELFNYSWNRINELGKSIARREAVLEKIKALDPIPDSILGSNDQVKKRVVLSHFKQNFPEYVDFYVNLCLDYYGGKKHFPNGNPTMNCQGFMNSEIAPSILDRQQIQNYQEIRKI
jgi:hypothetical protein